VWGKGGVCKGKTWEVSRGGNRRERWVKAYLNSERRGTGDEKEGGGVPIREFGGLKHFRGGGQGGKTKGEGGGVLRVAGGTGKRRETQFFPKVQTRGAGRGEGRSN